METKKLRLMEMKMSGHNDYGCEEQPLIQVMVMMAPVKIVMHLCFKVGIILQNSKYLILRDHLLVLILGNFFPLSKFAFIK